MPHRIVLASTMALALASGAHAGTLNKCTDANGKVTYSNLPCSNAHDVRTLAVDPAPPPAPARRQTVPPPPAAPAALKLENRRTTGAPSRSASRRCDALTDKLGRVVDRMDEARRQGYTQAQMDAWNREARDLERQKANAGCF